jgi:hypothetical protein
MYNTKKEGGARIPYTNQTQDGLGKTEASFGATVWIKWNQDL